MKYFSGIINTLLFIATVLIMMVGTLAVVICQYFWLGVLWVVNREKFQRKSQEYNQMWDEL